MVLESNEARFVEEGKVVETVIEFIMSRESQYTNATYYLQKRLRDLPAYIMPKLERNESRKENDIEKQIREGQDAVKRQISEGFLNVKKSIYGFPTKD